jgi:hypothetical protein
LLTDPPNPPKRPRKPTGPRRPRRETARLRADILDQLGQYQLYIKRLRRWDKEAFVQYRRIGAYVLPGEIRIGPCEIEPVFLQTLPGFGAIAIGMRGEQSTQAPEGVYLPSRFAYFMKLARPGHTVEQAGTGTTYRFQLYWDDHDTSGWKPGRSRRKWEKRGHGFAEEYLVNIADDGMVRALRVLKNDSQVIRHRKGGGGASIVHHQRWGLPPAPDSRRKANPAQEICELFISLMNFWVKASYHSMIRVTATQDNIVMPFIVDATDTPQFFADREPVVVEGVTKRIFHLVRAHARTRGSTTKGIRLHFAGLRAFKWNGYDIQITVPGREHLDIATFNVGALEDVSEEERARQRHLDYFEIGDWLADHIHAPAKLPREQVEPENPQSAQA